MVVSVKVPVGKIVAIPVRSNVMVSGVPPLMVYITTAPGVPLKRTYVLCPSQIVEGVPCAMVANGKGLAFKITV